MHEAAKLEEASFFLGKMHEVQHASPTEFRFHLSAFLSAARSVAQYALEEAKTRPRGQAWFDTFVAGSPVIAFFKDARDKNIHEKPVEPRQNVTIFAPAIDMRITAGVPTVRIVDRDGNALYESGPETPQRVEEHDTQGGRTEYHYSFAHWPHPDDVLATCEKYVLEMKRLVSEGKAKGLIP